VTTPADLAGNGAAVSGALEITLGKLAAAIDRRWPDPADAERELNRAVQPLVLPAVQYPVTGGVVQASVAAQTLTGPEDGQCWHVRRVTVDGLTAPAVAGQSATSSGQQTSPGAAATITSIAAAAGTYTAQWTVVLSGTLGAGDANNLQLTNAATQVATSLNAGAAGTYVQQTAQVVVPAGGATVAVKTIAAATVGGTYAAQLTLTPVAGTTGDQVKLYRETVGIGGLAQNKLRTLTAAPPNDMWEPAGLYLRSPEALSLTGTGLLAASVTMSLEGIGIDMRYLARYLI
jgi:hypothetical protein